VCASVLWDRWLRGEQRHHIGVHAAPQEGFCFQVPKLGGPLCIGNAIPLVSVSGFLSTVEEIPLQKSVASMLEQGLRAFCNLARESAGQNQKQETDV
jgi:hypothetical protein